MSGIVLYESDPVKGLGEREWSVAIFSTMFCHDSRERLERIQRCGQRGGQRRQMAPGSSVGSDSGLEEGSAFGFRVFCSPGPFI
jgi:hypothetical protein